MLCKRIIACLDVRDGAVVKGVQFEDLMNAGDPATLAERYGAAGADEIVMLDVSATLESRRARSRTIEAIGSRVFIPLVVGGGIRCLDDAAAALNAGADKVAINSAAVAQPDLITRLAGRYGSQAVVVAIDAARTETTFVVRTHSGTAATARDAVGWAREAEDRGAGEILLTSIDRDGTGTGFDTTLTAAVANAVGIPVIASGGAGAPEHFLEAFTAGGADAALGASAFHYSRFAIRDVKRFLREHDIPVRLSC
jgi:cyclase